MDLKSFLPLIEKVAIALMDDAGFPAVQKLVAMIPDEDLKDLCSGVLPLVKVYVDKKAAKAV